MRLRGRCSASHAVWQFDMAQYRGGAGVQVPEGAAASVAVPLLPLLDESATVTGNIGSAAVAVRQPRGRIPVATITPSSSTIPMRSYVTVAVFSFVDRAN